MAKSEATGRGKNFSKQEDRQIWVSWINISEDSVRGTDQNIASFWRAAHQHAISCNLDLSTRTSDAIRQRFGIISRGVSKFVGCVKSVERLKESGRNSEDRINKSLLLFKQEQKEEFQFMECWEVLNKCPKFQQEGQHFSRGNKRTISRILFYSEYFNRLGRLNKNAQV